MINVGQIKYFFEINAKIYCAIEIFNKKQIEIGGLENIKNIIERYFIIIEKSNEIDVVSIEKITRKCIKIIIDSQIYLTYCVDAVEHD